MITTQQLIDFLGFKGEVAHKEITPAEFEIYLMLSVQPHVKTVWFTSSGERQTQFTVNTANNDLCVISVRYNILHRMEIVGVVENNGE